MINIRMYPAKDGDCFLISLGAENRKHILIDCGYSDTYYNFLKKDLNELNKQGEKINLFIVTHIDEDHILGAIAFIEENNKLQIIEVEEVWYNCYHHLQVDNKQGSIGSREERILKKEIVLGESYIRRHSSCGISKSEISVKQAGTLGSLLLRGGYNWNGSFLGKAVSVNNAKKIKFGDISITILSPNNEKLEILKQEWLIKLKDKKWDFNVIDNILFNDAFEYMMLMYASDFIVEKKDVSLESISNMSSLENMVRQKVTIDKSPTNGSSISICINYDEKNLLFLADSHPDILCENIKSLNIKNFDLIKIPHHGSKKNMNLELAELLKSKKILISTNGNKHMHPDLETLSKLIFMNSDIRKEFYFNYETEKSRVICSEELKSNYNYDVFMGTGLIPIDIFVF